ncbi:hypothetical protein D918_04117 [Trichuris suis]|nr:hypothetical protein D918_04117 [Trichuris suis]
MNTRQQFPAVDPQFLSLKALVEYLRIGQMYKDEFVLVAYCSVRNGRSLSSFVKQLLVCAVWRGMIRFGEIHKIAAALGCPNSIYYKSEDKMKIHLPSTERKRQNEKADYFYNYFTLGLSNVDGSV